MLLSHAESRFPSSSSLLLVPQACRMLASRVLLVPVRLALPSSWAQLSSQASNPSSADSGRAHKEEAVGDPIVDQVLRSGMVAEGAAARLFEGQQCVLGRRPDIAAFCEREQQHLRRLQELAPSYRARPSLLEPLATAGFFALGAATAVLPRRVSAAVTGGLQEALTDIYNDQLRQLRESSMAEAAPEVREAVKAMRDEDRSIEGGPQVPDITTIQRWKDLSLEEGIAAVVKLGTSTLVNASRQI